MASKQKNQNIGMIACSCCGQMSAVRREKNNTGKFYWDCLRCGRIKPNMPAGQDYIMERATIWGPEGMPPENCPEWIAKQQPWRQALQGQQQQQAAAAPAPDNTVPPPPPAKKQEQKSEPEKPAGFRFLGW